MSPSPPCSLPRVGIGVLIFRNGQVLVGKRKGSHGAGTFALPGGHLEFLESIEACAIRETLEETGLKILNPRVEWVENSIWGQGNDQKHYVTIFVRADLCDMDAEAQVLEPEKCELWQWIDWPSIPGPVFQPLQQLLESNYDPARALMS